jgi:hypothetical protein
VPWFFLFNRITQTAFREHRISIQVATKRELSIFHTNTHGSFKLELGPRATLTRSCPNSSFSQTRSFQMCISFYFFPSFLPQWSSLTMTTWERPTRTSTSTSTSEPPATAPERPAQTKSHPASKSPGRGKTLLKARMAQSPAQSMGCCKQERDRGQNIYPQFQKAANSDMHADSAVLQTVERYHSAPKRHYSPCSPNPRPLRRHAGERPSANPLPPHYPLRYRVRG